MYKFYKELRDTGRDHYEASDMIDKSERTLFRYQAKYRELHQEELRLTSWIMPEPVMVLVQNRYAWHVDPDNIPDEDKIVGVISDLHMPATDMNLLKQAVVEFDKRGVNTIVCTGDLYDNYRISFHDSDPDAMSEEDELQLSYDMSQELANMFPYMVICEGNHTKLAKRQALKYGISLKRLKSYHQLYNLPESWEFVDYVIINDVKYQHGDASPGGVHGGWNTMTSEMMSSVVGHTHSNLDIKYRFKGDSLIFGATAGCLIDRESYAFRYNRAFKNRPIHGVMVVYNSAHAEPIPLEKR